MSTTTAPADTGSVSVTRDDLLAAAEAEEELARKMLVGSHVNPPWPTIALVYQLRAVRLTLAAALQPPQPRADAPPEIEPGWYGVDLMGHRTRTGHVRPVTLAGRPLIEIREPEHRGYLNGRVGTVAEKVEYYSPAAIFSLHPTTETAALEHLADRDADIPF